jgi:ParB family chromosome partitioning protein
MKYAHEPKVQMIPIDKIRVLNSRTRAKEKHRQITNNIGKLRLKKPVNAVRRVGKDGEVFYELACGQGRLEAYENLGQTEIPALLVDTDREGLLLMSLAENLPAETAPRWNSPARSSA